MLFVDTQHVGRVCYNENGNTFERIIAGRRIPDSERCACNRLYEYDIHLEPVDGAFSGSYGFADFSLCATPSRSVYLAFIGVEPEYREMGIGRLLVKAVEQAALDRMAPNVWARIDEDRMDDVYPFFSKLGFAFNNAGTFPGFVTVSKAL